MAGFYSARGRTIPPLPWPVFALPLSGSDGGGRTWATIATLLQTALCRARHKHVYADRRTMPINEVFANVFGSIAASE
ncbi:hypothetical protein CN120_35205 [Sinorhizobium meliloti]|nr:hypothetical protein CN235_35145 [Sinorhizobium meliloti]RVM90001.1 hypothetical protein CN120_35205 [Sinorhizobium meliloti]